MLQAQAHLLHRARTLKYTAREVAPATFARRASVATKSGRLRGMLLRKLQRNAHTFGLIIVAQTSNCERLIVSIVAHTSFQSHRVSSRTSRRRSHGSQQKTKHCSIELVNTTLSTNNRSPMPLISCLPKRVNCQSATTPSCPSATCSSIALIVHLL